MTDKNDPNSELPNLDEIIALMPGNIYWKDRQGRYLGCNDNIKNLLHLSKRTEIVGKTLYDLAPKMIADEITEIDNHVMDTGHEYCAEEEAFDEDHNQATYFTRKVPLKSISGKIIGLVGISLDITERKNHEKAIEEARKKAEAANRAKSAFIMNMSHDIRTPFSGVLGLSRFLLSKETDPEKKDILKSIVDSSENLLDILNEVLELTTKEEKLKSSLSHFDLPLLFKSIYDMMIPAIQQKNLKLKMSIDPAIPMHVYGDEYAIKRILINLVGNAIKFTNVGGITISTALIEKNNKYVTFELKIKDTGIGIPKENQEMIFEQFNTIDNSYESKNRGTGLGLWFVKQLVKNMKGTVQLESEPGKGSTFTCVLQVQALDDLDNPTQKN